MLTSIPARLSRFRAKSRVAICARLDYQTGVMKLFPVFTALVVFGLCSCERHEWESETPKSSDTINLFKHGEHGAEHDENHPGKEGEHAKPEGENEKEDADSGE